MLKLSMAASLLAITLSVDAFAAKPDETDETGKTTTAHRGPVTNRQELENAMEEWFSKILILYPSFTPDDLRTVGNMILNHPGELPIDELLEELRAPLTPKTAEDYLLLTLLAKNNGPEKNKELLKELPTLTSEQINAFNFLSTFSRFLKKRYGTEDGENTTALNLKIHF